MKSVNAHWMSDSFHPVAVLHRLDEQRPGVLEVGDHDHRDQRGDSWNQRLLIFTVSPP